MSKTNETEETQQEQYIRQYGILSQSAVGVILTRTKEPHRAAEALQNWAFANKRTYRVWNAVDGWREKKVNSNTPEPRIPKSNELYKALGMVDDTEGDGSAAWKDSLSVVHYPHWMLPKHGPTIQLIKEYVQRFYGTKQRVVLLTPDGFTLPRELENDVPILDFDLPGKQELREAYDIAIGSIEQISKLSSPFKESDIEVFLKSGAGMTFSEFETAMSKGVITHRDKWPKVSVDEVNKVVLEFKTEVIKRSEVLELMAPVSMDEVGGLDLAKEWINKRKVCFGEEAAAFGVDIPKGIAALGPPGTGKTLLAKAVSSVLQMPLIRFDVGKVFGSLVGQSEERVRSALKQLDAMAPCVALIDEVDKAGIDPRQAGGDSGTSKRVMGAVLTHMQETKAPVFWILTANRVAGLPPELLRKGRLDEVFAVLPPNDRERMEVMRIHLRKRKQDPSKIKNLEMAVRFSKGFVSAEIEAAIKESVIDAFTNETEVTGESIAGQLKNMKPISEAFPDDFNEMKTWAQSNARMASLPDNDTLVIEEQANVATRVRRRRNME